MLRGGEGEVVARPESADKMQLAWSMTSNGSSPCASVERCLPSLTKVCYQHEDIRLIIVHNVRPEST